MSYKDRWIESHETRLVRQSKNFYTILNEIKSYILAMHHLSVIRYCRVSFFFFCLDKSPFLCGNNCSTRLPSTFFYFQCIQYRNDPGSEHHCPSKSFFHSNIHQVILILQRFPKRSYSLFLHPFSSSILLLRPVILLFILLV